MERQKFGFNQAEDHAATSPLHYQWVENKKNGKSAKQTDNPEVGGLNSPFASRPDRLRPPEFGNPVPRDRHNSGEPLAIGIPAKAAKSDLCNVNPLT